MGKVPRLLRARRLGQIHNEKNGMCMMATVSSKDGDTVAKAEFVPVKRGNKRLKKDPVVEAIRTMKHVVEKDPSTELL